MANESYRGRTEVTRQERHMGLFHVLRGSAVIADGALFPSGVVSIVERMTGQIHYFGDISDAWNKFASDESGFEWIWANPKEHPSFRA